MHICLCQRTLVNDISNYEWHWKLQINRHCDRIPELERARSPGQASGWDEHLSPRKNTRLV